ncbi:alpha/beta fold hydrolase [Actinomycetota bacterium Odt1-20B]
MTSTIPAEPKRAAAVVAGRRLSFLDFGGPGRPLPALHGHFGEGRTFTHLARELGDSWRVIAPDQRGHGHSDRPADFSRTGYVEGIEAEVDDDLSFSLSWPHRAPTQAEPLAELGPSAVHLMDAVREHPDGWGLSFDPEDMNASQELLNGDHRDDWLAGNCPALLIRGSRHRVPRLPVRLPEAARAAPRRASGQRLKRHLERRTVTLKLSFRVTRFRLPTP